MGLRNSKFSYNPIFLVYKSFNVKRQIFRKDLKAVRKLPTDVLGGGFRHKRHQEGKSELFEGVGEL